MEKVVVKKQKKQEKQEKEEEKEGNEKKEDAQEKKINVNIIWKVTGFYMLVLLAY